MSDDHNFLKTGLSVELYSLVIDHLHDDKYALAACILVHKSWVPTVRYHLFNTISLRMPTETQKFIMHLKSSTSTIGPYIRHIKLSHCALSMRELFEDIMVEITRLTPITKLTLSWMEWVERGPTIFKPIQLLFSGITDLRMEYSEFGEFNYLANLISCFPSLETMILSVELSEVEDLLDDDYMGSGLPPRLQTVEFIKCSMVGLLQWFASYGDSIVNTLRLDYIGLLELEPTRDCLRVLGASLRDLRVHFGVDTDNAHLCPSIDLANNHRLRSVRFDEIHLDANYDSVYRYIPAIISQITSNDLESIIFELIVATLDDLDQFDWEHLERIFDEPRFSGIRTLGFHIHRIRSFMHVMSDIIQPLEANDAIENFIRRKMYHCDHSGIIHCVFL